MLSEMPSVRATWTTVSGVCGIDLQMVTVARAHVNHLGYHGEHCKVRFLVTYLWKKA